MAKKLTLNKIKESRITPLEVPNDYDIYGFSYRGRPAKDQDDFGSEVGIADMVHIEKDGKTSSQDYAPDATNKYYHGGVVQHSDDDSWWVYLEWGTAAYTEQSWIDGDFRSQQDAEACKFQFVECTDEDDARLKFQLLMRNKNIDKITQKKVGSAKIWVCKPKKNSSELETGYLVQQLSSRSRGLPHAYSIIETTDKKKKKEKKKTEDNSKRTKPKNDIHPKVQKLAQDLLSETHGHTKDLIESHGLIPTSQSIKTVREDLLPEVSNLLQKSRKSKKDIQLIEELSNNIASMIPRPIPLRGSAQEKADAIILSPNNIELLEKDMDAFEAMIEGDLLQRKTLAGVDVLSKFKSDIEWIDPESALGKWVAQRFTNMNRRKTRLTIVNMFKINRDRCDNPFIEAAKKIASANAQKKLVSADAQPSSRPDTGDYTDNMIDKANIIIGFHGTPSVNVQPILASNLRMPTWSGLYGAGLYFATDRSKSNGYCGGTGNRGTKFIFIHDVIIGHPYMAQNTGSWTTPPQSKDSIFFHDPSDDDEHIIFHPHHQRIRYLIEFK